MEPWFAALACPTPQRFLRDGRQQRLGLAHLPSQRGVRTSKPLQLSPLSTRHLQGPSRSHHPTHTTTDHYLSDTRLGSRGWYHFRPRYSGPLHDLWIIRREVAVHAQRHENTAPPRAYDIALSGTRTEA